MLSFRLPQLSVILLGPVVSKLKLELCSLWLEVDVLISLLIIDEMLPFSRYMDRIWKRTKTPVIAVWVNVFFCACLGLIDLGSFTAISAIFNVPLARIWLTNFRSPRFAWIGAVAFHSSAKYSFQSFQLTLGFVAPEFHTRSDIYWKSFSLDQYMGDFMDHFCLLDIYLPYNTTRYSD